MGLFKRLIGRHSDTPSPTAQSVIEVRQEAEADGDGNLIEIDVVGESHYQQELQRIAGPKEPEGKQHVCGVTLRCEPKNEYDINAIRVEVMGLVLGYLPRDPAGRLSPLMQSRCRGAIEARGLIVGGWDDGESEGHYGLRIWITPADVLRLGVDPAEIERRRKYEPVAHISPFPPTEGELRLSPETEEPSELRVVTVTHEEHYQPAIDARRPSGWVDGIWSLLVGLDLALDPHRKLGEECIRVHTDGETVGFLTPAMTKRHGGQVRAGLDQGLRPTAEADVRREQKKDVPTWQVTVYLTKPRQPDESG